MIQHRYRSGSEVVEEPSPHHNTPGQAGGSDRVARPPQRVATIIDIRREREQAAAVRRSLIGRIGFESLALELGYHLRQHANRVQADSDNEGRRRAEPRGRGRGHGTRCPQRQERVGGVEDGIE